jgi:hypothetical protein
MNVGSLVSGSFKSLGPRFNLIGLLPGSMLVLFLWGLYFSGAPGKHPDLRAVFKSVATLEAKESVALAVSTLTLALLFQPLQLAIVRLLEGYWGLSKPAQWITARAVARHRRARVRWVAATQTAAATVDAAEQSRMALAAWRLGRYYPPADLLLPTELGNSLRAAETRAGRRYGLDGVVVWPRLYPLISTKLAVVLADQRDQLDLAARFCVVFLLGSAVAMAALLRYPDCYVTPALGVLLAWLSYRSAVAAAVAYGQSVEVAFDLHRFDLLRALHLPLPWDRDSERAANAVLCDFLRQDVRANFLYEHPKAEPPAEDAKGES